MKIEVEVEVPEGKLCYFVGATNKEEIGCQLLGDDDGTRCHLFMEELNYDERSGEDEYAGEIEIIFKCQQCLDAPPPISRSVKRRLKEQKAEVEE